jgi:hypothetical protein
LAQATSSTVPLRSPFLSCPLLPHGEHAVCVAVVLTSNHRTTTSPSPFLFRSRGRALETLAPLLFSLSISRHLPLHPFFFLFYVNKRTRNSPQQLCGAVATRRPHRPEGIIRCGSSSSSPPCKESSQYTINRAQGRRFSSMAATLRRRFRPPSSSSGQTEHTSGFLVFSRIPDAQFPVPFRPGLLDP